MDRQVAVGGAAGVRLIRRFAHLPEIGLVEPKKKGEEMGFFSDRGVYNNDPHKQNRLNERYNHIILPNLEHVAGKRLLDLGSFDGRWIWACLESGASFVTGVEGRAASAEAGQQRIPQLELRYRGAHEVLIGDAFDLLSVMRPYQFDTILCLGLFYHILNHERLVAMIARLQPRAVIIDSGLLDSDEMIIKMKYEATEDPLMGLGTDKQTVVGIPSRGCLAALGRMHGFRIRYIEWSGDEIRDHYDIDDYLKRQRFTCVLTPSVNATA